MRQLIVHRLINHNRFTQSCTYGLTRRSSPNVPYFLPCPIGQPRDGATPRDHPSQGHGSSRAAFHQMPRYTADDCASIVPGHMSSPFRRSFNAELLAMPAPERGLAAAASSSSTLGTGCSSWSPGCFHWFLFLLVGVVLNRRRQIAGIVRCVCGSHRCTPLVARDGLGLLVVSSRRRA